MVTEKRFYLDETGINDREYEFSVLSEDELVDIINELSLADKDNTVLKKENEQLKQELKSYKPVIFKYKGNEVILYYKE